jgi:two-component system chemotaxis response regulator CheY
MIDINDELARDYLTDCQEHLVAIEADLLALEPDGAHFDEARINRVFRGVHFIWGGATLFDLKNIRELAHKMEEVIAPIRSQAAALTPAKVRILISAAGKLNDLIEHPAASDQEDIKDTMTGLDDLIGHAASSANVANAASCMSRRGRGVLRILLAEDDFACRLLLQTFLSRYGECHSAVSGAETVEAFRIAMEQGRPYDLICMDIMMPEMDGREAVRRVREMEQARGILSTSGVKIIMTTTVEEVKEVMLCFKELCDAYLIKPIDLAELVKHMRDLQLLSLT